MSAIRSSGIGPGPDGIRATRPNASAPAAVAMSASARDAMQHTFTRVRNTARAPSPRLHAAGALQLAPADHRSAHRLRDRLQHDVIHDLAIADALRDQQPQQAPLLAPFQCEGDRCRQQTSWLVCAQPCACTSR
ncbi:hypothetical protein WR25_16461 [Diploscapter pachys]|uniref:Uncharacterized protein n=1 Tax=Diploscapter pachys TaxID=2018661 RepID=A0A2A2M383_9BILA|nr:hypothetical protein WR25_16461 [Diploscapter pachys]